MHRFIVNTIMAATLAGAGTTAVASAHGWHGHGHHHGYGAAYAGQNNGLIVGNDGDNDDVQSVAEPAAPQYYYSQPQVQYAPANDTIVTPYGYTPAYNNGYYQGYSYGPQYPFNPYYAGAANTPNPIAAAVVSTIIGTVANGGHIDSSTLVSSLLTSFLASQYQQQPYGYGSYPPGYGYPPQPQPGYGYGQPVYYGQQQPTLVDQLVPALLQQLLHQ